MHETSPRITLDFDELFTQAHMTANDYFIHAKNTLEKSGMKHTVSDVIALAGISCSDFNNACSMISNQIMSESLDRIANSIGANKND